MNACETEPWAALVTRLASVDTDVLLLGKHHLLSLGIRKLAEDILSMGTPTGGLIRHPLDDRG